MTARARFEAALRATALAALVAALAGCGSAPTPLPAAEAGKNGPLHHYQLGRMYFEQGKVREALEEIDRSLRIDDSLPQVWFYRGYIYWNLSKWKDAEEAFRTALVRNPYYTDARMWLATCLDQQGKPQEALNELDRAAEDRSFQTPEKIQLTKAKILDRQGRLDEALATLRSAVTLRPRFYEAHFAMALVLSKLGRLEEAQLAFDAAEPGYAKDAEFHWKRGEALFRMRRKPEAAKELRRAQELAPGSEAAANAGQLLKEIG